MKRFAYKDKVTHKKYGKGIIATYSSTSYGRVYVKFDNTKAIIPIDTSELTLVD